MEDSMRIANPIVLVLLTQGLVGCGNRTPVSPTAPTTAMTPTPVPTITRVAISGNVPLTTIGETAQLTATATLSDNTTKNVTTDGRWQAGDARIVTVSQTGLLSVVGFGSTWTSFTYQSRSAGITVAATPSGTFVIAGRVREPGAGGINNVRVVDELSGRAAVTDSDGYFSLAELPRLQAHLKVEKEAYEPVEVDVTAAGVDLPLQRVVRIAAGAETLRPDALAPNDLSYTVDGMSCKPCRLIRVVVPQAGTLHVGVKWTVTASKLSLFAEGQVVAGAAGAVAAEIPVNGPSEVLIYLGAAPPNTVLDHTPFSLETSMR
jgi:TolB-like protein